MAMVAGEFYHCTDEDCGCEIHVMKAANGHEGAAPQCSCGEPMKPGHTKAMGEMDSDELDSGRLEVELGGRGVQKTSDRVGRRTRATAGRFR